MEEFQPVLSEPPAPKPRTTPMQKILAFVREHPHEWVLIRKDEKKSRLDSYGGNIHGGLHVGVAKHEFAYRVAEVEGERTVDDKPLYGVWVKWDGVPEPEAVEPAPEQPAPEAPPQF